jgi:hypothetical protein
MSIRSLIVAVLTAVLASFSSALAQPLGPEFLVNTYTTGSQDTPAVAADGGGNFVAVWTTIPGDGTDPDLSVHGQRYDNAGVAQGAEFQVNTYTTSGTIFPTVACDSAGDFVVVWRGRGTGSDSLDYGIQGQRFDSTGTMQGTQFQVNTYATGVQNFPGVAAGGAGNFVVVWESPGGSGSDTDSTSIQAQRYDSAGVAQGGEFQVNTYTTGSQRLPVVAADAAGNFVVVWNDSEIRAQRYDSAGVAQGGEFQVNTYTTGGQDRPAVARNAGGSFVVVWESTGSAGSDTDGSSIHGQRYDSAGVAQGGEFQVNSYTTGNQTTTSSHLFASPSRSVAIDNAGNFVAVWASSGSGGSDTDEDSVQGQRYDSAGVAQGGEFQVNSATTGRQELPAVAAISTTSFVVLWNSGTDVRGQLFGPAPLPTTDLLPGRVTIVKPLSLAKFVTKPPTGDTFAPPTADPVVDGGSLRIFDSGTTAGDDTYSLPAGGVPPLGWKPLGNPPGSKGYKYKGAGSPSDPCKIVLVKQKIIKGVCTGPGVTLIPPFSGDVSIELSLGTTDRYCAEFGGGEVANDATITKRKDSSAPAACP